MMALRTFGAVLPALIIQIAVPFTARGGMCGPPVHTFPSFMFRRGVPCVHCVHGHAQLWVGVYGISIEFLHWPCEENLIWDLIDAPPATICGLAWGAD